MTDSSMPAVAVIADIVGSRTLDDRAGAQAAVRDAFTVADAVVAARIGVWPTVGDEFQAVYDDVSAAVIATTVVRLALPDGVDVRFGIGDGVSRVIEQPAGEQPIYDGSAWWNARGAIEEAERRGAKSGSARSWARGDGGDLAAYVPALLLRDHLITSMKPRERRIALRLVQGALQSEIAQAEGVSQSAVSQSARRSGANALVQAVAQWQEARS